MGKFFKYLGIVIVVIILIACCIALVNTLYHNQNMEKKEQTITTTQDIKQLKVSSRYHVEIKYGDDYHLVAYTDKNKQPIVESNQDQLTITTPNSWFGKLFSGLRFGNPPDYIELTLPRETQLDNFDYHGQNGLSLPQIFKTQSAKLSAQFGDVTLADLQANNVDISLQFGNVSLKNATLVNLNNSVQFGNVSVKDTKAKSIEGSVQFGNLEVLNQTTLRYDKMKFETQFGNIKLDNLSVPQLTTSAIFGGITKNKVTEQ
ncbi:DUF4097 family beta strand repeat-containing protein [Holzapfeliella sp. He02]|uniref:DUF4097 family beta strand repeat-containing protein n=1 Tax=Holzapfeliella saturejae TaxID=3082953 RepID=A0ABU8SIJ8_9LACO